MSHLGILVMSTFFKVFDELGFCMHVFFFGIEGLLLSDCTLILDLITDFSILLDFDAFCGQYGHGPC